MVSTLSYISLAFLMVSGKQRHNPKIFLFFLFQGSPLNLGVFSYFHALLGYFNMSGLTWVV